MQLDVQWERNDYSRVPYKLYHDPDIYRVEQERIFRGRAWSYLCLRFRDHVGWRYAGRGES
jgi:anthranilate 1,2-dioxygenase large subunit